MKKDFEFCQEVVDLETALWYNKNMGKSSYPTASGFLLNLDTHRSNLNV